MSNFKEAFKRINLKQSIKVFVWGLVFIVIISITMLDLTKFIAWLGAH